MIWVYGSSKFKGGFSYMTTGYSMASGGSATITDDENYPKVPRLPMFPNQTIERTWLEYFRTVHRILQDHLEDYAMHRIP